MTSRSSPYGLWSGLVLNVTGVSRGRYHNVIMTSFGLQGMLGHGNLKNLNRYLKAAWYCGLLSSFFRGSPSLNLPLKVLVTYSITIPSLAEPMGQEPISCFCSVRQLDVQVHPLDMMLVCDRELPPIQPLMLPSRDTGDYFSEPLVWPAWGWNPQPLSLRAVTQNTRPLSWLYTVYNAYWVYWDMFIFAGSAALWTSNKTWMNPVAHALLPLPSASQPRHSWWVLQQD